MNGAQAAEMWERRNAKAEEALSLRKAAFQAHGERVETRQMFEGSR